MNIQDLTYKVKAGESVLSLLPITSVITNDDVQKYTDQEYRVLFTKDEFEKKFPNLDVNKFFYNRGTFPSIVYFDREKIIYKRLPFNGKEYFRFDTDLSEEEEIIKIINIFEKLYDDKEWSTLITNAEGLIRFYLLDYIIQHDLVDSGEIYDLFIDIYTRTDYGFNQLSEESINKILSSKSELQKQKTKSILSHFGNTVTIYRGEGDRNIDFTQAFSWTTDINVANFFATRLSSNNARIIKAKVKRSNIIEYINNREEREVLIKPENVEVLEIIDLYTFVEVSNKYMNDKSFTEFTEYKSILKHILSFKSDLDGHGKIHCLRVLLNAIIIANHENIHDDYDRHILFTACISHDMARDHDGENTCHGAKSYTKLIKDVKTQENKELEFLMKYHSIPDRHGLTALKSFSKNRQQTLKKLLYILKDADGLDRIRFGLRELDMNFLRLDFSKQLTFMAYQSLKGIEL